MTGARTTLGSMLHARV